MEKRNFVTPMRTSDASLLGDSLVESAAALFSGKNGTEKTAQDSSFVKKAHEEDVKSDRLH